MQKSDPPHWQTALAKNLLGVAAGTGVQRVFFSLGKHGSGVDGQIRTPTKKTFFKTKKGALINFGTEFLRTSPVWRLTTKIRIMSTSAWWSKPIKTSMNNSDPDSGPDLTSRAVLPKGDIAEAQTWIVARPAKHHPHCLCVRCVPLLLDNIKLLIDLGELGLYLLLDVSQGVWRGLEYESLYNTRGHQRVADSYRPAALGRCHLLHLRSFDKIRQYR